MQLEHDFLVVLADAPADDFVVFDDLVDLVDFGDFGDFDDFIDFVDFVDLVDFVAAAVTATVVAAVAIVGHFFRRHRHRFTVTLFELVPEFEPDDPLELEPPNFECNFCKIIGSGPANASASGYAPGSP